IFLFGPSVFSLIFGAEWHTAGEFASWMALWSFMGFINRPCVSAIPVLRLQGLFLIYEVMSTLMRASALYLAFRLYGTALSAVVLFSIISVFLNGLLIAVTFAMSKRSDKRRI